MDCQLQQTELFTHEQELEDSEDHIYIVFGDEEGNYEHVNAVTNRRSMFSNPGKRNELYIAHYCDYCNKKWTVVMLKNMKLWNILPNAG